MAAPRLNVGEPVCALATAPGGPIAVVRCTGDGVIERAASVLRTPSGRPLKMRGTHRVKLARVVSRLRSAPIDEVLVLYMRSPRTFTGEDVIELHCHGGRAQSDAVLDVLVEECGFRMAEPGEFSYRACINGKMSLIRAEAMNSMIKAVSDYAAGMASSVYLAPEAENAVEALRRGLLDVLSRLEASVDFVEDTGLEPDDVLRPVEELVVRMKEFLESYEMLRKAEEGFSVVLCGPPNAGKSSIFNRLLRMRRSIVSGVPGTTRDFVSARVTICEIDATLYDTAGLRSRADDEIEAEGMERTLELVRTADLVLLILDASDLSARSEASSLYRRVREQSSAPVWIVWNKCDRGEGSAVPALDASEEGRFVPLFRVSALTGAGVDELLEGLSRWLSGSCRPRTELDCILTTQRQYLAMKRALGALTEFCTALRNGIPLDMASFHLAECRDALAEVVGEVSDVDLYEHVFSSFCIGK